ncbi:hypothetical protein KC360_g6418 [Hortaea werneckii]|nr:hypothetical protein KC325_g2329 [Hortaea werneckii]KAI6989834.1 hypothetical protein KC359_g7032 [Hortaea werneckii]KAI7148432.1 hypothetical protein KC344_g1956 [Hortaea werneckii]KAI7171039.1 hypothetical protein KC360_g6418 [Hortaea werneckii]
MHPLFRILAFLGLVLAAPTPNDNATSKPTVVVTDPTTTITIAHASTLSRTSTVPSSTSCPILIENTPWLLTNTTHFVPSLLPFQNHSNSTTTTTSSSPTRSSSSSASAALGFISFHFRDTNRGLELETRCFRTLPRYYGSSSEVDPKPGGTYFPCEDGRVRFAYTAATAEGKGKGQGEGGMLKVGRVHRDDW